MWKEWHWYVFIILCDNGTYYTGLTWNWARRWDQHASGNGCKYTKKHKPVKLVYVEEHHRFIEALDREKQIKDWSQAKKRRLIDGTLY